MENYASRLWDNTKLNLETFCMEWQGSKETSGYGQLRMSGKLFRVHRLAYELTKGQIPQGLEILHSCDNRLCINPDHLSVGTHQDNMTDMKEKGKARSVRGSDNHKAVVSEEDVLEIRRRWAAGEQRQVDMAKEFGLTKPGLNAIIKRRTWRWL